jgi:hypothetical protein
MINSLIKGSKTTARPYYSDHYQPRSTSSHSESGASHASRTKTRRESRSRVRSRRRRRRLSLRGRSEDLRDHGRDSRSFRQESRSRKKHPTIKREQDSPQRKCLQICDTCKTEAKKGHQVQSNVSEMFAKKVDARCGICRKGSESDAKVEGHARQHRSSSPSVDQSRKAVMATGIFPEEFD